MPYIPDPELLTLPQIKQCTVCGKGTARRWPTGVLECDVCGTLGDPYIGMMQPRVEMP